MAAKSFTVAVATPGTPQQLSKVINALVPQISGVLAGPVEERAAVIIFQADPGNTASKNIYIGGPTLNVGTRVGIGMALAPGAFSPPIELDGSVSLSDYWYDIDTSATVKNLFVHVLG
jgi:hypothetical protein